MRTPFLSNDYLESFHGFNRKYNKNSPENSPRKPGKSSSLVDHQDINGKSNNVLDVPLITVNKMVFRSKLENGTYKPMDLLTYTNLLKQLKEQSISPPPTPTRSRSTSVQIKEKLHIRPKIKRQSCSLDSNSSSSSSDDVATLPHPHPFNRNRRSQEEFNAKALKARSVLLEISDEILDEEEFSLAETSANFDGTDDSNNNNNTHLEEKFENFMKWVNQAKQDYVAMETVNSLDEFPVLFKLLEKYTSPTLLQIKTNVSSGTWTVVCQPLEDFKKEYMVLRIGLKYCLCMEPF